MTDLQDYNQVEPIKNLYDGLFNLLEIYGCSKIYELKSQPRLYAKYGKKLEKLVNSLEKDLTKHCRELDIKLSSQTKKLCHICLRNKEDSQLRVNGSIQCDSCWNNGRIR